MIGALVGFGRGRARSDSSPSILAWGSVVGSVAAVRRCSCPTVVSRSPPAAASRSPRARRTFARSIRNFCPVFVSRGVVQISAYVDTVHREPAADGRGHGARQRATALHAAGQPLRHVGFGGGASGDVGRRAPGRRARAVRMPSRRQRRVASRSSSCRPRWLPGARRRDRRRAAADGRFTAARLTSTCGGSSRARPSACSRRRPARLYASALRASATRRRRCDSRSRGS